MDQKKSRISLLVAVSALFLNAGAFLAAAFTTGLKTYLLGTLLSVLLFEVVFVIAPFTVLHDSFESARVRKVFSVVEPALLFLITAGAVALFTFALLRGKDGSGSVTYYHLVMLVVVFILSLIADKFLKHREEENGAVKAVMRSARAFLNVSKVLAVLYTVHAVLLLIGVYDSSAILLVVLSVLFYYCAVMILVSLSVRLIRKELASYPLVVILLPFVAGGKDELSVLSFLEENTGITLKNLWSLKFLKKVIPFAVLAVGVLFWLSTGIVYVESHQRGVVYRFGSLKEQPLAPGLHFTLPYPFDKTEVIDTEPVRSVLVGFTSGSGTSNVWTEGTDDRFLLGSGDEIVALNIRVEYKIGDVVSYVTKSSAPENVVRAFAYELATDRTMNTDLDTLLAVDREAFASKFLADLRDRVRKSGNGIEVVSVVMESIHPPVEVASVYQQSIAVGIDADRIIKEANGKAAVKLHEAEMDRNRVISTADTFYYRKTAEAKAAVSDFMASVGAYKDYKDAYTYYKYLNAIGSAYQNSNLVIIGEGVDGSRIYWGTLPVPE